MKSNYTIRAKHFIEQFFNEWHFTTIDFDTLDTIREYVQNYNTIHHRKVEFNHGLTRIVFITSDYVIKIDYNRTWAGNCEDEYNLYHNKIKNSPYFYLFAEITRYEYNGIIFYIMPRIYNIDESKDEDVDEYLTGEEYEFIYETLQLHDLHSGNYGWKNKKVIIVDYAFHD